MHLPNPPTDEEMAAIEQRIISARHATHVSTASGRAATDPTVPGELTVRQRRRIEGLARAIGEPLPQLDTMTHPRAEAWIQQAEGKHRRISMQRNEL